jgi:hydroxymethylpyrimidine pyrophosphatase-like HAD family hydrolase
MVRYVALLTDYDGTLAYDNRVGEDTIRALERVRASGRQLILVTGRELPDLVRVFSPVHLFDRIVAENGALLHDPASETGRRLVDPPPPQFVRELQRRGVSPLSIGEVIVATRQPHETAVFEVIRDLALELQVIFNKGAVMVLPSGVNKATGLRVALAELGLSMHNTVGIGDAENDQAFLAACECGVAVGNALDSVKARADLVTVGDDGAGVVELVERLVATDLEELAPRLGRHEILLAHAAGGEPVRLSPFDDCVFVAGPEEPGEPRAIEMTAAVLGRLASAGYQYCLVDPDGVHFVAPGALTLTGTDPQSLVGDVLEVLARAEPSVCVSLREVPVTERDALVRALLPRLQRLRATAGRPHWIVLDNAHRLLPAGQRGMPCDFRNVLMVSGRADRVSALALSQVQTLILAGTGAARTFDAFARAHGGPDWARPAVLEDPGPAQGWLIRRRTPPLRFTLPPKRASRRG